MHRKLQNLADDQPFADINVMDNVKDLHGRVRQAKEYGKDDSNNDNLPFAVRFLRHRRFSTERDADDNNRQRQKKEQAQKPGMLHIERHRVQFAFGSGKVDGGHGEKKTPEVEERLRKGRHGAVQPPQEDLIKDISRAKEINDGRNTQAQKTLFQVFQRRIFFQGGKDEKSGNKQQTRHQINIHGGQTRLIKPGGSLFIGNGPPEEQGIGEHLKNVQQNNIVDQDIADIIQVRNAGMIGVHSIPPEFLSVSSLRSTGLQ